MNPDELLQTWTRFKAGESIHADEVEGWCENIVRYPEVQRHIVDDRAIEGLLQLHAVDDDGFVSRCLMAWENETAAVDSEKSSSQSRESLIVTVDSKRFSPSPKKRRWAIGTIGWCVSAAAALALLTTTAIVHWTTRGSSQPISQKHVEKSTVDPEGKETTAQPPQQQATHQRTPRHDHDAERQDNPAKSPEPGQSEPSLESKKPSWQPLQIVETEQSTHDRAPSIDPPTRNRTVLGTIEGGSKAVWKTPRDENDQLTPGPISLVQGQGTIQFDNGIILKMLGPAELHVENPNQIHLMQGQFYAEIPRKVRELNVVTPDAAFINPQNARVQWSIRADSGTEVLITRGTIDQRGLLESQDARLVLSKNRFFQSLVRPVVNTEPIVRVAMAQAENDFIGRIDKADDSLVMRSPPVFANLLRQMESPTPDPTPAVATPQNWQKFFDRLGQIPRSSRAEDMQRTMQEFLRAQNFPRIPTLGSDDQTNSSFSFQATISVNGRQHSIGSDDRPDGVAHSSVERPSWSDTTDGTLTDVPTPVFVGGVPLRFKAREEFRQIRRLMGR